MSLVSVITCTGFRPEAFQLCYKYMKAQTYKGPLQWIVVNDAYTTEEVAAIKKDFDFELYAGPVKWTDGTNTQRWNMVEALKHVRGDKILIMEDEDYYAPSYIEQMVRHLDYAQVVGEGSAKYYNVSIPGWKEMRNLAHASLCQTGLRQEMLPLLRGAVDSGELYFDIQLWRQTHAKNIPSILFHNANLCIGIKGMPGRSGIGAGHKSKDYLVDPGLSKLKEWLKADAENYTPFARKYERKPIERSGGRLRQTGMLSGESRTIVLSKGNTPGKPTGT